MHDNEQEKQIVRQWAESWEKKFDDLCVWAHFTPSSCHDCGCMETQVRIRLEPTLDPPGPDMVSRVYHCLNSWSIKRVNDKLVSVVRKARHRIG